jgi:hypothetical protein
MVAAMVVVVTQSLQGVTVAASAAMSAAALPSVACTVVADFTAKHREARDSEVPDFETRDFAAPECTILGSLVADTVVVPIFIPAFASRPALIVFVAIAFAATASAGTAVAIGDLETSASAIASVSTAVGSGGRGGGPATIPGGIRGGGIHILPTMKTAAARFKPPMR